MIGLTRLPSSLQRVASIVAKVPGSRSKSLRQRIRRTLHPAWLGTAHRRTKPFSDVSGYDRGTPIDRIYIRRFLEEHRGAIHGRVLEVQNNQYSRSLGSGITSIEILDVDSTNPRATLIRDLGAPTSFPEGGFDCFILTQTLQYVFDSRAAVLSAHRVLRPGGVLLATVPAVSRRDAKTPELDYWRFTKASCARLFGEVFSPGRIQVRSYGNVLAAAAFLKGMAAEELRSADLDVADDAFPVIIAVRAERG